MDFCDSGCDFHCFCDFAEIFEIVCQSMFFIFVIFVILLFCHKVHEIFLSDMPLV